MVTNIKPMHQGQRRIENTTSKSLKNYCLNTARLMSVFQALQCRVEPLLLYRKFPRNLSQEGKGNRKLNYLKMVPSNHGPHDPQSHHTA